MRLQRNIVRAVKLILFSVLLFVSRTSHAQNAPTLHEHQFVYGMPEGYVNPAIGANGVQIMEQRLATLRNSPFFVVMVDTFDANGEDVNRAATRFADNIMATWRAQSPQIFTAESGMFLLIRSPRKFRLNAGSRWSSPPL
ncbi:hypothetical protein KBA73_03235, partial [Patescibacteria group bacterium]|nr:hypothetical protein [Patescibacteria group bacterium]